MEKKAIVLTTNNIKINVTDYISLDVAKRNKAIPFEVEAGKIKVCFSETTNTRTIEAMRLLFLNKGLVMEKYITFTQIINSILTSFESTAEEEIDVNADISGLLDSVIKTAMEKRASDIHIEPEEDSVRVRYRIDGELVTTAVIEKEKTNAINRKIKSYIKYAPRKTRVARW